MKSWQKSLVMLAAFVAAGALALWSWNALAALFSAPTAQFKHVLAAVFLLLILRFIVSPHVPRISETRRAPTCQRDH
jgi:hypothetical protein